MRIGLVRTAITFAIMALLLAAYRASKRSTPATPLPNPNGYDDFVAAGRMLPNSVSDWNDLDIDDLRTTLASNQPALTLTRRGLTRKSQVPVDYSPAHLDEQFSEFAKMKQLARAFAADGKLAEAERRVDDAANDYASMIALGIEANRGGYLIHSMVQIALEALGAKSLAPIVSSVNAPASLECLHTLEKAEGDRDSFDKFKAQERLFYLHAPLRERLADLPLKILGRDQTAITEAKVEKKYNASELVILKLEAQLAERAFALEKRRAPTNWGDLVPAYLANVPNDPTTHLPMAFHSW